MIDWKQMEYEWEISKWSGFPIVTSRYIPEGTILLLENKVVIWGTGPLTDEQKRKKELLNEIRKMWWADPSMRKWYEYIGEDWSHL